MRESKTISWEDIIQSILGKNPLNFLNIFREVIIKRYVIIEKVGWGHFSTVWLAKDFKYNTFVAIKIQKSAPHYLEAAYDEVEILQTVARHATSPEWMASLKEYYKDVSFSTKSLNIFRKKEKISPEMIVMLSN